MNTNSWFAIVNPASANQRTGKEWPRLYRSLASNQVLLKYALTSYPGEGTLLTRQALKEGFTRILTVGGDGTLNEVVNGFYEEGRPLNPDASLAILSHGTGGDFLKSMEIPQGLEPFLDVLKRQRIQSVDLGLVRYLNIQGELEQRYFLNVADVGLGGETVARVNRHSKIGGGRLSFLLGSIVSILTYKNKPMKCTIDGKIVMNSKLNSIMVANGRFIGGGMKIAPDAQLNDGLLNIIVLGDFSTLQLLKHLPKIYNGSHLNVPGVSIFRGRYVTVEAERPVLLDLDGEQPGCTPVTFSIIPQGIKLWT